MGSWQDVVLTFGMWYGWLWLFTEIYQPPRWITPKKVIVTGIVFAVITMMLLTG